MTIGKSSKKQKAPRSPPFLDRASGFYGRLDESEVQVTKKQQATKSVAGEMNNEELFDDQEHCLADFSEGMMEDDGTTLLKRKPSRLSRRWSKKSSRKTKSIKLPLKMDVQSADTQVTLSAEPNLDVHLIPQPETASGSRAPEPTLIHFSIREEADDQKLISEAKEMKEIKKEGDMEGKTDTKNMKVFKRNSLRNYHRVRYRKVMT